jgi:hypothetical protein
VCRVPFGPRLLNSLTLSVGSPFLVVKYRFKHIQQLPHAPSHSPFPLPVFNQNGPLPEDPLIQDRPTLTDDFDQDTTSAWSAPLVTRLSVRFTRPSTDPFACLLSATTFCALSGRC